MAKKKPGNPGTEEAKGDDMTAAAGETNRAERPRGKPGKRPGPFWRTQAGRWCAKVGGKQHTAPAAIGRYNAAGARAWYEELVRRHARGGKASPSPLAAQPAADVGGDLPGSPTEGGSRRLAVTLTETAAANLRELAGMVAAERMVPTVNYSGTITLAVQEALARRRRAGG